MMKKLNCNAHYIEAIIEGLEDAVNVNYRTIEDPELGYPYAAGYSREAMKTTVSNLKTLLKDFCHE
jgi:hypothetical protein